MGNGTQSYSLLPRLSLLANVKVAARAARPDRPRAQTDEVVERYLTAVGPSSWRLLACVVTEGVATAELEEGAQLNRAPSARIISNVFSYSTPRWRHASGTELADGVGHRL